MTADDPLAPHSHDPNPDPPTDDPTFILQTEAQAWHLTPDVLRRLPRLIIPNCTILSTGHPPSGPFAFGGVPLLALIEAYAHDVDWAKAEVVSDDGFGTRLLRDELRGEPPDRCCLLATEIEGRPLTRAEGLVRLIVPSETDDALRQVKWVARIKLV